MQYKSIIATNRSLTFGLVAEGELLSEVLIRDLGVEGNRERSTKASGSSGTRLVHSEAVEGVVEFLRSSIGSGNKLHDNTHTNSYHQVNTTSPRRGTDSELLGEISRLASLKLVSQFDEEFVKSLDGSHPFASAELSSGTEEGV